MFKPTKARIVIFLTTVILSFSPLLIFGSGLAVILPAVQIFWLSGLASALGVPVAAGGGVDAFNLIPASATGGTLILVGLSISLGVHYAVACFVVRLFRRSA